jgi:hypothetical protein
MNRFGRRAQELWQSLAPAAYSQIEDPNRHFSTLGEQAETAWIDLSDELAGPDSPGETYFEKVGRLNNARKRAEEVIQEDWLTPPPETIEHEPETISQDGAREWAIELEGDEEALADRGITLEMLGWTKAELAELREELTSD